MYIEEKEAFIKWYTENGWEKLSFNCYYKFPSQGGSERWLYGIYLTATS